MSWTFFGSGSDVSFLRCLGPVATEVPSNEHAHYDYSEERRTPTSTFRVRNGRDQGVKGSKLREERGVGPFVWDTRLSRKKLNKCFSK